MLLLGTAKRLSSAKGRRRILVGGLVVAALLGGTLIHAGYRSSKAPDKPKPKPRPKPVAKGQLLCPGDAGKQPVLGSLVFVGDHVVLKLQSKDKEFAEDAWGRVLAHSPEKDIFKVEIVTPLVASGLKPLRSDKHGFHLAEKILVRPECFYDVLHNVDPHKFDLICGVMLTNFGHKGVPEGVFSTKVGDVVTILVGNPGASAGALPGSAWTDEIDVRVTNVGPTGDVLRGAVVGIPKHVLQHKLSKNSVVEFTRDCIIEV